MDTQTPRQKSNGDLLASPTIDKSHKVSWLNDHPDRLCGNAAIKDRSPRLPILHYDHDVRHVPEPFGHASDHGWRTFRRRMDAGEVVGHEVQRHNVRVILDFLRESVG
jgi:hypothetical protein